MSRKTEGGPVHNRLASSVADTIGSTALAVALAGAVSSRLSLQYVPTDSMAPTLGRHSVLLAAKFPEEIRRGDIISFFPRRKASRRLFCELEIRMHAKDPDNELLIKRCVGLPGDTIRIRDGLLIRNGCPVAEPYLPEPMDGSFGPYVVPEGCYFFLGDNRNHSGDSREFGAVPADHIFSRALVYFSPAALRRR